jgi:hypothetical protein
MLQETSIVTVPVGPVNRGGRGGLTGVSMGEQCWVGLGGGREGGGHCDVSWGRWSHTTSWHCRTSRVHQRGRCCDCGGTGASLSKA